MEFILDDIIIVITSFLDDKDKISFLSLTKKLHLLKNKVYYNEKVYIDNIIKLSYYDMFTVILTNNVNYKFPKFMTHLIFAYGFNQKIRKYIPNSVAHLTFCDKFNQKIRK